MFNLNKQSVSKINLIKVLKYKIFNLIFFTGIHKTLFFSFIPLVDVYKDMCNY